MARRWCDGVVGGRYLPPVVPSRLPSGTSPRVAHYNAIPRISGAFSYLPRPTCRYITSTRYLGRRSVPKFDPPASQPDLAHRHLIITSSCQREVTGNEPQTADITEQQDIRRARAPAIRTVYLKLPVLCLTLLPFLVSPTLLPFLVSLALLPFLVSRRVPTYLRNSCFGRWLCLCEMSSALFASR